MTIQRPSWSVATTCRSIFLAAPVRVGPPLSLTPSVRTRTATVRLVDRVEHMEPAVDQCDGQAAAVLAEDGVADHRDGLGLVRDRSCLRAFGTERQSSIVPLALTMLNHRLSGLIVQALAIQPAAARRS